MYNPSSHGGRSLLPRGASARRYTRPTTPRPSSDHSSHPPPPRTTSEGRCCSFAIPVIRSSIRLCPFICPSICVHSFVYPFVSIRLSILPPVHPFIRPSDAPSLTLPLAHPPKPSPPVRAFARTPRVLCVSVLLLRATKILPRCCSCVVNGSQNLFSYYCVLILKQNLFLIN